VRLSWSFALLVVITLACRDPRTMIIDMPLPPPPPECGDGVIQEGEDCDGSDQGTGTCQSKGFDMGRILCSSTCTYDTTLCVKRCGNGVLDLGESCDGTLGVMPCTAWGFNACTATCTVDVSHCVMQAFEAGPELDMAKGGPAAIGDFSPAGPGDLVMAVPSLARLEIIPWTMARGFDGTASRKLSFLRDPRQVEIVDVNGDSTLDAVALNADGSFDFLVNQGATYGLQTVDAGCPTATFLPTNGSASSSVTAVGCASILEVRGSGVMARATPSATGWTRAGAEVWWFDATPSVHFADAGVAALPNDPRLAGSTDLDGDGDLDLAIVDRGGLGSVIVLENTGNGFAMRTTFSSTAITELRVLDVDGDGQADLLWTQGDAFVVRRNRGSFVFTETRVAMMSGTPSLAVGDVDGDRDLDVVITVSSGGDSTKSRVFLNRVR
jgi:hypothetical protein